MTDVYFRVALKIYVLNLNDKFNNRLTFIVESNSKYSKKKKKTKKTSIHRIHCVND